MTSITLLHLALALLIAAQQPNVPETLKNQAIFTAQTAIAYAQQPVVYNVPMAETPQEQEYTGQRDPETIDPNVMVGVAPKN